MGWLFSSSFINNDLSKRTSIFGLRLYVVIGIVAGAFVVLFLFLLSLCLISRRSNKSHGKSPRQPSISKANFRRQQQPPPPPAPPAASATSFDIVKDPPSASKDAVKVESVRIQSDQSSQVDVEKGEGRGGGGAHAGAVGGGPPQVSHLGWGHWFTLRELEEATAGFSEENVIGEGGYGIVYKGVLADNTMLAIKNLLNNE